nr:eukaryotic translation initiation factor 3 [Hymenolepis microstoma]
MRPICLRGHERPITQIVYNRDGDLIFTAAKNETLNVWFSQNGERLGSFNGHNGVVWSIDVDWTSTRLISGSGDYTMKLWDISNGKKISDLSLESSVRVCKFSYSGNLILYAVDPFKNTNGEVRVIDTREKNQTNGSKCLFNLPGTEKRRIVAGIWGDLEDNFIVGKDNGNLEVIELRKEGSVQKIEAHKKTITDIQKHVDGTMFLTASKDYTAKLFGIYDFDCVRTYTGERPVNSAAMSPNRPHVLLGGGQEAEEVTTTAGAAGKFDAKFFHMIYAEEFGTVKGHFGPINSVAFNPDGSGFATGGEDGYVRLHKFDPDYDEVEQRLFSIPSVAVKA